MLNKAISQGKSTKLDQSKNVQFLPIPQTDHAITRRAGKKRLAGIVDEYKKQDLQLYVIRQAHAKSVRDNNLLVDEEKKACRVLQALLIDANKNEIDGLTDVMNCFELWHAETIQMKKSWEISEIDKLMLKVFRFLREQAK